MRERVIDFCYFDSDLQKSIPKRNFKPIVLDNQSSYHVITKRINTLICNKDTINGIDILISDHCKYHYFISVVDFFLKSHYDYWYAYSNHIKVVFSNKKSECKEQILFHNFFNEYDLPDIVYFDNKSFYQRLKNQLKGKIHDILIMDWHFLMVYFFLIAFVLWTFYNLPFTQKS